MASPWAKGLLSIVLLAFAYAKVRQAGFIWDDDAHVTTNPVIVGPLGLAEIWTSAKANYFPLTMTSFWALHALWGLNPVPYHVATVLFHLAAALVLWRVLARLEIPGAWLGAMLWALHPVQVESVAWISELKNTQSGLFFLLSVWFFIRWLQQDAVLRLRPEYGLALLCAILAILSKSSTVMLPVVLGLAGWWLGRRDWRQTVWLIPFFVFSLAASGWTIWEQKVNSMASGEEWGHGWIARATIAGKVIWFYLGKLAWPDPLVFIYPRWDTVKISVLSWLPVFLAMLGAVWLWRNRDGPWRGCALAFGYFGISLFPVLGFFDVFFFRYSFVGDHFQYLASMGPLALAGAALTSMARTLAPRSGELGRGLAGVAVLAALALLSRGQSRIYQTNFALWHDTVRQNPESWIARVNLGSELTAAQRPTEAIDHFAAALKIRPQFLEVELNWGGALLQLGKPGEALTHLERALAGKHAHAEIHHAMGVALSALGRLPEAIERLETACRLRPDFVLAHQALASALLHAGQYERALAVLDPIVRAAPRSPENHVLLARILAGLKRLPEAIGQYQAALGLAPDNFDAHQGLSLLFFQSRGFPEAVRHGERAVQIRPESAEARQFLANALLFSGQGAGAIAQYEQALRLDGSLVDARSNLATALYQLGQPAAAVPHYAEVARLRPESAETQGNLGSALLQSGRTAEAVQHLAMSVRLAPNNPNTRANYALALGAAGKTAEAIEQCREALRLQPGHPAAQSHLQHLEKELRERSGAK